MKAIIRFTVEKIVDVEKQYVSQVIELGEPGIKAAEYQDAMLQHIGQYAADMAEHKDAEWRIEVEMQS